MIELAMLAATAASDTGTPIWVTLIVGFGGAAIGAGAAIGGQVIAGHYAIKQHRTRLDSEERRHSEEMATRHIELQYETKLRVYARVMQSLNERGGFLVDVVTRHGVGEIPERLAALREGAGWYDGWREASADAELLEPSLRDSLHDAFMALREIEDHAGSDWLVLEPLIKRCWATREAARDEMRNSMGVERP